MSFFDGLQGRGLTRPPDENISVLGIQLVATIRFDQVDFDVERGGALRQMKPCRAILIENSLKVGEDQR